jgi:hypothetical protein
MTAHSEVDEMAFGNAMPFIGTSRAPALQCEIPKNCEWDHSQCTWFQDISATLEQARLGK